MPAKTRCGIVVLFVMSYLCITGAAAGKTQTIETISDLVNAIEKTDSARVVFFYQTRDGVYGDDNGLRIELSDNSTTFRCRDITIHSHSDDDADWQDSGFAEVELKIRRGNVRSLSVSAGDRPESQRRNSTLYLGEIPSTVAAEYLMQLAMAENVSDVSDATLAAVIARDGNIIAKLFEIVNDKYRNSEIRNDALFWLANFAGEKANSTIKSLIYDESEDTELRETAIFTLTHMDKDRALPILMDLARNSDNAELQQAAFFGLSRFDAPQVVELFEQILLGD